jgi:hypothetical protein
VPSRTLEDCLDDVKKLYREYSHAKFTKSEMGSAFGVSAATGPFAQRLFSIKEFGLLEQSGGDYSASDTFMTLNSSDHGDARFKQAALEAIRRSEIFREVIDSASGKLPSVSAVAHRLETQKRFNAERAKKAADVLEKSMLFAGVLDNSNNILPVRDTGSRGTAAEDDEQDDTPDDDRRNGRRDDHRDETLDTDTLSVEIPVGEDRKVTIRYPRDLSTDEATKVGNVLSAIVG